MLLVFTAAVFACRTPETWLRWLC